MRRAATEKGLWERLVRGITPPTSEKAMVQEFLAVYGVKASNQRGQALAVV
jgi:hypothetical protein